MVALLNVRPHPEAVAAWIATHPGLSRHVQRTIWLRRGDGGGGGAAGDEAALAAALRAPGAVPEGVTGVRILSSPARLAASIVDLVDDVIPLDPRAPSHHLCVARLPAGGDWTAGQRGEWNGQSCPWAGQATVGRPGRRRRAAAAKAGDGQAADAGSGGLCGPATRKRDGGPDGDGVVGVIGNAVTRHELRWCFVPAGWGWIMPPEPGDGRFDGAAGSAVHKLDEALRLLGLDTRAHHAAGRAGGGGGGAPWAIDLGAAPGAWTQHLAGALGYRVVAVDPGALAPEVLTLPGVHHVRALSEDAAGAVRALLRGGGGGGGCGGDGGGGEGEAAEGEGGAEVLVSDMNMHPFEVAPVVLPLLSLLKPGGLLVLTLKLPGTGRNRTELVARTAEQLRTLIARRAAAAAPPAAAGEAAPAAAAAAVVPLAAAAAAAEPVLAVVA
ncbi:hypothetical protein MNEG_8913 [Monoraphidium neglectum]|uniref:Ribosomal RNA methyltransferase FtsJ domain-containing protein n=1 Tax=Monoraphidium neglectum TaxID=145388 RepID=A0A0D2ME92_9CHLO|nr:hypothetical protein MNEG_8913 [Monoraphidium neglectum]KIY99051.1 hypothetical protein MNEG_8913 [Monoraphidium neglectum]|eukprot:XP_013898071.1 hypothetical protein MNEG_8913 [Monoraphidium neglectum]